MGKADENSRCAKCHVVRPSGSNPDHAVPRRGLGIKEELPVGERVTIACGAVGLVRVTTSVYGLRAFGVHLVMNDL